MKISNRFTIAVHILSLINVRSDYLTSQQIANSVNINAGYIRQISGLLKKAEFIGIKRGSGGAYLLKAPTSISLYDVYKAVDVVMEGELFHWHEDPNPNCWIGSNIQEILDIFLLKAQQAMEGVLREVSIQEITELIIKKEKASTEA
jgi:DNA-binding IscR family transcriptional regulator